MKKLLILFPNAANWAIISTSIPILAGVAKQSGWSVDYFDTYRYEKSQDATFDKEKTGGFRPGYTMVENKQYSFDSMVPDIQAKIDAVSPDLVAINAMSHEFEFLLSFYPKLRFPERTKVVIGGIHSILRSEQVASTNLFDLVCTGEGEITFKGILDRISSDGYLSDIIGTFHVDRKSGVITRNEKRKLLTETELWSVDEDYSFYDDAYFLRPFDGKFLRRLDVEVARGCPYTCHYCGNSALKEASRGLGKFLRQRSFDSIFSHFKKVVKELGIEFLVFTDECFLAHSEAWLQEFAARYSRDIRVPFMIQTRSETVTEKKVQLLESFGAPFFQVSIGVESGSEHILKDICGRRSSNERIIQAFDILNAHKIRTGGFFMVGLPYESREDIFKTIELCRRIKPTVMSIAIYQPLPGQKLTEECIDWGFITGNEPMLTFTSGSILKQPQISAEEIHNLWRTFALYAALPYEYYSDIEKCEKDYDNNQELYDRLIKLRWEKYAA